MPTIWVSVPRMLELNIFTPFVTFIFELFIYLSYELNRKESHLERK